MFRHLSLLFEVSLLPILLTATTDYETGSYYGYDASAMVYKCVTDDKPERTDDEDMEDEDEDEDEEDESNNREFEFYLYDAIDVRHISSEEYIEHTGNESLEGSTKYFGGGMFLREKQGPVLFRSFLLARTRRTTYWSALGRVHWCELGAESKGENDLAIPTALDIRLRACPPSRNDVANNLGYWLSCLRERSKPRNAFALRL
ncbi:hypothetical protein CPB85DRAFT_1258190 [Mucidula mucida]|nr:hypothetical protein CPB85DRAFT_1258190 [Mucidula mucida]